ncbi:MAG: glycosyltransferase [Sphingomicrobium sp.]
MRKESRQDQPLSDDRAPLLYCDLTQSWSEQGGGVRTYLLHKRQYILEHTPHRHLLIIPGAKDDVVEEGRAITVTIASRHVPGSPNYRLLLRNGAVRRALERFRPDLIECQDVYNLPWAALAHQRRYPQTAVTAVFMTDFPTVYVERPFAKVIGRTLARQCAKLCYAYCGRLYRRLDRVFALGEHGGAAKLRALGVERIEVIGLGVDTQEFGPQRRDPALRAQLGLSDDQPLLIYVGRLDREKKPDVVVDAFRRLPGELGAKLVLIGDGPLRTDIAELGDTRIHMLGFVTDRADLARWLASADLYASGMADETFGISIIEAQASGLPVVGVAAGAMIDRVPPSLGRLGPVGDSAAMARNIRDVLSDDRTALADRAVAAASTYEWDRVLGTLFGSFYHQALERRVRVLAPKAAAVAA